MITPTALEGRIQGVTEYTLTYLQGKKFSKWSKPLLHLKRQYDHFLREVVLQQKENDLGQTTRQAVKDLFETALENSRVARNIYTFKTICDESNNPNEDDLTITVALQPNQTSLGILLYPRFHATTAEPQVTIQAGRQTIQITENALDTGYG